MIILLVVGAFIVLQLTLGLYIARKVQGDSTNYIVAGRGLILPLAAATLMAQAVDSNATLGNTDLSAQFGFWAGASLPVGLALCLFLTGLFFAKPMNRMGLLTLPDFYRRKYGRTVEMLSALIMILGFTILLAGNIVAGGFLFETFMGTSYATGVIIIIVAVFAYTIAGGMFSDTHVSVLQLAVALAGAMALLLWVAMNYGISFPEGMGPFAFSQLTDPAAGAYINWATLLALGLGDIVAIDFMQRVFAAESPETAQRACFAGAIGTLVIGVPFAVVALSAGSILEVAGITPDGPILYALLQDVAPPALAALVLSGIIAASFSTADGAILGTAAVFARNVMGIRQEFDEGARDRLLTWTRVMTVPITLVGIFFAIRVPETGILLTLAFDVLFAGLLVPFVLGLYWSGATGPAALAAIIAGTTTRLAFFVLMPTVYTAENTLLYIPNEVFVASFDGVPTLISPLVGLTVFVVVALATNGAFASAPAPSVPAARDRRLLTGPVVRYQINGSTPLRNRAR
ncbi:MAG: sodium:solute symporter family protein [Rubrobacter sp.]|nr:sodium:solute symporter family protein [Rubrobacter sp.]